ncbi:MAG: hypothetical protein R6W48_02380 [Gaiellaceae bacterium]
MNLAGVTPLVGEATSAWKAVQGATGHGSMGGVAVSGVLAEQLARELGDGAEPGVVHVVDAPPSGAAVAVRVIAAAPTEDDERFVSAVDSVGTPVVVVQLWPQADWTPPFVLSPHVVECRAGEGFPVAVIASRIAEAVERAPLLAARVPTLRGAVGSRSVYESVARTSLLALTGRSRPAITLEQLRLVSRLRSLELGATEHEARPTLAATAAALVGSGFALRAIARSGRRVLPAPMVNAAVAAAGTWALAEALRRIGSRSGR